MKNILFIIFLFAGLNYVHSQKQIVWFDAGLKAQYGATGFYNSAMGNFSDLNYRIGTGYSFGGKIGINFRYNGLAIDVMYNKASQPFDYTVNDQQTNLQYDWNSIDVYALFRHAKNLGYFEIGPKISFVDNVSDNLGGVDQDRSPLYNKNFFSGVIGFGANIIGNDGAFSGILGLRFEYGFTDFVNEDGKTLGAPLINPAVYTDGYKSTAPAFAGIVFEINWGIGYFAKAQCGARSKFIKF
ncbi:MAG: hypothetical protein IPN79_18450 [Saprospiraceae bacterium]|nr:hypothetical protein [Saprospiraceae bacterium]